MTESSIEALDHLPSVTLAELNAAAALQERVDRKYIVTRAQLTAIVVGLADRLAVLQIDQRRNFGYESSYFDTESLSCFWESAQSRPGRVKVRTRSYLNSGTTMLEVKIQDDTGKTTKLRQPHGFDLRRRLDAQARNFVDHESNRSGFAAQLVPVLTTTYHRATLIDRQSIGRLTVDTGLVCRDERDREVGLHDLFVVESKSLGAAGFIDNWLWEHGIHPEKISKYGTGMAALHPTLATDKWQLTLDRHFKPALPFASTHPAMPDDRRGISNT